MTNKRFLHQLFDMHIADLRSVRADIRDDIFVCPICFREYQEEAIASGALTDGHVWPEYMRKKSKVANSQHVLLCRQCNLTAGSRGDKQMQLMELVRNGDAEGNLYGERSVQVIAEPGEKPINITVAVKKKAEKEITIIGNWNRSAPAEKTRFENFVTQQRPFSMVVNPYHELKPELTKAGWVTSAYLLAFYSLGYRYVLHESTLAVRQYILGSFQNQPSSNSRIKEYRSQVYKDPEIVLAIPVDGTTFVHLEVNFLKYQISLPMHFVPSVLSSVIDQSIPDWRERIPGTGGYIFSPITCSKQDGHDCIYDYIMGKPIPIYDQ